MNIIEPITFNGASIKYGIAAYRWVASSMEAALAPENQHPSLSSTLTVRSGPFERAINAASRVRAPQGWTCL